MTNRERTDAVALVAGSNRREMVRKAITLLQEPFRAQVESARSIFVHPNLVTHHRKEAVADVEAVRGVIDHLSLVRGDEVLIGDAGFRDTKQSFETYGYASLSRSGNVRLVDLNDDETVEAYAYTADWQKKPIGFSKTVAQSDCTIVVVPAKMHSYTHVSLSVKTHTIGSQVVPLSPVGLYARWPWNHTGFAQFNHTMADTYERYPAQMAVIDATEGMEGDGPASGEIIEAGWVVASLNPPAADALACYLMGVAHDEVPYLGLLAQRGFGPVALDALTVLGDDPEVLRRDFKKPSSYPGLLES